MVDPSNITNYNLTYDELEERILFWVCAAGKNGKTAAKCLNKFLTDLSTYGDTPFESIFNYMLLSPLVKTAPILEEKLKCCGIGCYNNKAKTIKHIILSNINLKTCSSEELESIYGIGMKTSRCFILHSREGARIAGLDTHMLKHLKDNGVSNVPKSTPTSKKEYLRLEKEVLALADKANMSSADYDLMVWNFYSK